MEHSIFGAKPFSLSGLSPHAIKERRRENFSGGRRWRWRISVFASMKFKTMKFLSHFIPRAHLCLRVCALLVRRRLSSFSFLSQAPRRETAAWRVYTNPICWGAVTRAWFRSRSLSINRLPASLRAQNFIWPAARVNLSLPKHSIRRTVIIVRNTLPSAKETLGRRHRYTSRSHQ